MSNTIKLKSSATPGKVPLSSDLASGEVAINTADGKLFALVGGVVTSLTAPPDHTHTIASITGLQDIIADLTKPGWCSGKYSQQCPSRGR